ncbi:hypothetical protein LEP1GSC133_3295 [Leptospira borgpetersenii serovar Pomona str. 200901868]|uniref:Uncharacterized protein n=1 Tax=Leptospira borgpetersenii serovar Pomona str. 200901868 TaxID=1192866 RepID=M6WI45_LEPBO|nr:hypothetical protein LEP1GSC133_3295 [Leptospira borgpetersenii serovar Pomona str. 200901868]
MNMSFAGARFKFHYISIETENGRSSIFSFTPTKTFGQ